MSKSNLLGAYTPERLVAAKEGLLRLTHREHEVLYRLIRGETAEASANALGVAARTVEAHRQSVLSKLQARNMVEAVGLIAEIERQLLSVGKEPTDP